MTRRLVGGSLDLFLVPESLLTPGVYTWRVQAACSTVPPYSVTPISAPASFTVDAGLPCPDSVQDVEGNVYPTVEIGGQCWMERNLATGTYKDGSAIPTGLGDGAWSSTSDGAVAIYGDDPLNGSVYGRLYNWHAVNDPRGLCPVGWRVPTDGDWTVLTDHLGGEVLAGTEMKSAAIDSPSWDGTNTSGFSGLPGGERNSASGAYANLGYSGAWWSATEASSIGAHNRQLFDGLPFVVRGNIVKNAGFSIRCLQD